MTVKAMSCEILLVRDVAEYLKITERIIYRVAAAKQIQAFKVGERLRFSKSDIETLIKTQSVVSQADQVD